MFYSGVRFDMVIVMWGGNGGVGGSLHGVFLVGGREGKGREGREAVVLFVYGK